MKKKVIFIGAGGHAKSVLDCLDKEEYELVGFIDNHKVGSHCGVPILGKDLNDIDEAHRYIYFVSIGDNRCRMDWFNKLNDQGLETINIISPKAVVSVNAKLGKGVFVGHFAVINSGASVDDDCIINTMALVEHECHVGKHCHISTKAVINGGVIVEDEVFLGSGATVNGQLQIKKQSIIGSGSVVIRDVKSNVTVVGNPARVIKERE